MSSHQRKDDERTVEQKDAMSSKEQPGSRIDESFDGKTLRTNPFGRSISAEYGYRRAERITAAIHLLTSHIENTEPFRIGLRKESIRLLDHSLLIQGELRATGSERVREMNSSIRKLISLVRLASISGRISAQNAHVTEEALDELGNFLLTSQRSSLAEAVPLTRDDLIPRSELRRKDTPAGRITQENRKSTQKMKSSIKDMLIKDSNVRKESPSDSRSSRVMGILRTGGTLGIKDIASQLPEYSVKMIQRDLALLVDAMQVRKIGSKRWSQYELVS